ncbi:RDD family protein [uncultured Roseovarius sp.]|uniref:RDD family protein n=1 Tax=uncultured Roseovarius sp. TaxID=293344 RepID=UPI00262CFDC6|nr:RDD family protein [uncultured Roseovarius sp.]
MTDTTWHIPDPLSQPDFYADVPTKRLIAWVVDTVVITGVCLLILPFTAFTGLFFFPFLFLCVSFIYRVITIAGNSATWGMRLTAIEFRTGQGRRFDLSMAFLHTLGYSISWALFIFQIASIVLMLTTARGQGLSDHMLGTVAINRRARS